MWHSTSPSVHAWFMYLEAVRGRFTEQKSKSDMESDKTKAVVAWLRSLGHLVKANTVTEFPKKLQLVSENSTKQTKTNLPMTPTIQNMMAQIEAITVASRGYLIVGSSVRFNIPNSLATVKDTSLHPRRFGAASKPTHSVLWNTSAIRGIQARHDPDSLQSEGCLYWNNIAAACCFPNIRCGVTILLNAFAK